jgi:dTDP-4-dehydrorhamnose 3,5-epimerase
MIFTETPISGVVTIDVEPRSDDRGFFARSYCPSEFSKAGIDHVVAQENVSFNLRAGTCRGIHFQIPPFAEAKLVRCTAGRIFDVAIDLRPESSTFGSWFGAELSAANRTALYLPPRCGHAYLTLDDNSEVTYQVSQPYTPEAERGLPPEDPTIGIIWPLPLAVISPKDREWQSFAAARPQITEYMATEARNGKDPS